MLVELINQISDFDKDTPKNLIFCFSTTIVSRKYRIVSRSEQVYEAAGRVIAGTVLVYGRHICSRVHTGYEVLFIFSMSHKTF